MAKTPLRPSRHRSRRTLRPPAPPRRPGRARARRDRRVRSRTAGGRRRTGTRARARRPVRRGPAAVRRRAGAPPGGAGSCRCRPPSRTTTRPVPDATSSSTRSSATISPSRSSSCSASVATGGTLTSPGETILRGPASSPHGRSGRRSGGLGDRFEDDRRPGAEEPADDQRGEQGKAGRREKGMVQAVDEHDGVRGMRGEERAESGHADRDARLAEGVVRPRGEPRLGVLAPSSGRGRRGRG